MTHEEAFLQDILDDPDDDAPRLIFADWLEEHGELLRAEFIRADCELANLSEGDPRQTEVAMRAHALRQRYEPVWRKTIPEWAAPLRLQLHRGFGAGIYTTTSTFLRLGWRALRAYPIQHADLSGVVAFLNKLTRSRLLASLRSLELADYRIGTEEARQLAACPHLAGLSALRIEGSNSIGPEGARALAESPYLANLAKLTLATNWMRAEGEDALRQRFGERFRAHRR